MAYHSKPSGGSSQTHGTEAQTELDVGRMAAAEAGSP